MRLVEFYRKALSNLQRASANGQAAQEFRRAGEIAPAEVEAIRAETKEAAAVPPEDTLDHCRSLKADENPAPFGRFFSGNRLTARKADTFRLGTGPILRVARHLHGARPNGRTLHGSGRSVSGYRRLQSATSGHWRLGRKRLLNRIITCYEPTGRTLCHLRM